MMRATATDTKIDTRREPARDRDQARREPPPRDTTTEVRGQTAVHPDDGSHTPPHGDALLPTAH